MAAKKKVEVVATSEEIVETEETITSEEIIEAEEAIEKPYTFRKLSSTDVFIMFKIISKIGINDFMSSLKSDSLQSVVKLFMEQQNGEKQGDTDNIYIMGAVAGALEIANVLFANLPKCENEIYQLLSQTSNLSVEEIKAEGNAVLFFEMVIDFLKKEEFPSFFKAVSRLFK